MKREEGVTIVTAREAEARSETSELGFGAELHASSKK